MNLFRTMHTNTSDSGGYGKSEDARVVSYHGSENIIEKTQFLERNRNVDLLLTMTKFLRTNLPGEVLSEV